MSGVILLGNNHIFNYTNAQELFDIAIQPAKYDYFLNFVRQVCDTNLIFHY